MLGLGAIFGIVNQGLAIVRNATDPAKQDKKFNVALKRNWHKALNIAEDICDIIDEYQHLLPKSARRSYKKLKRRFNDLD